MKDIANALGISKVCVSLALRGAKNISEETKKRVFETAYKMGYKKDALLSNVMANIRSRKKKDDFCGTIALINANKDKDATIKYPIFEKYISGIRAESKEIGYSLYEVWLHDKTLTPHKLSGIMKARGIRGGIILGHVSADSLPIGFSEIWRNFKFVSAGIKTNNPMVDFVSADKFLIARHAAEKAIEKGCKRLGLVLEKSVDDIVDGRFSGGFLRAQLALPEKERIPPFLEVAEAKENPKIFYAWMKKYKPDSILSISTQTREWLESDSVTLPEDIGIICIDTPNYGHEWVGLDQNYELVGKMAVRRLSDLLNRSASSGSFGVTTATVIAPKWTDVISIRHKTYSNKPSH